MAIPSLHPKPAELGPTPQISLSAINQLIRALPRVVTGDGVLVKQIADRWIIEKDQTYVYQPQEVQNFVVVSEQADYLTCVLFYFSDTRQGYDAALAADQQRLGLTGSVVYVAKPWWIQQTPWDNKIVHVNGVDATLTFPGIGQRVFDAGTPINQSLTPSYFAGDILIARATPTGIADPDGNPILWMDLNAAARGWNQLGGFADPTALVGLTVVPGTAPTAMRSDAAPPIDEGISPIWTGKHRFTSTGDVIEIDTPNAGILLKAGTYLVFDRMYGGSGTPIVISDVTLGVGWGASATVKAVTGDDTRGTITVETNAADTPTANPTLTLTSHDGTWGFAPYIQVCGNDKGTGPLGNWNASSISGTAQQITYVGTPTPTSKKTYIVNYFVMG